MSTGSKALAGVLAVLGLVSIVIGVMYLAVDPVDLPSFLPGPHDESLRYKRRAGLFGFIGVVLLALSAVAVWRGRHPAVYDDYEDSTESPDEFPDEPPAKA